MRRAPIRFIRQVVVKVTWSTVGVVIVLFLAKASGKARPAKALAVKAFHAIHRTSRGRQY